RARGRRQSLPWQNGGKAAVIPLRRFTPHRQSGYNVGPMLMLIATSYSSSGGRASWRAGSRGSAGASPSLDLKSCVALICCLTLLSLASSRAFAGDWPQFRGPTGQGISTATDVPVEWDQ